MEVDKMCIIMNNGMFYTYIISTTCLVLIASVYVPVLMKTQMILWACLNAGLGFLMWLHYRKKK